MAKRRGLASKKPLVPPPMKSMKRAREVTSSFHRLTRELQDAAQEGRTADAAALEGEVERLGGCAQTAAAMWRMRRCSAAVRRADAAQRRLPGAQPTRRLPR
jgi:hypothetical protein